MPGTADLSRFATTREILRQPSIWRGFAPTAAAVAAQTAAWIAARQADEVWLCGAGTSAFIGETLAAHLNRAPGPARFRAIPTTDLVACPTAFIRPGVRPLVVSFGRSGNSSESIGTLKLLATHLPEADRLHITCNGKSALADTANTGPGELRTIILPPETDDQGFAMTSSYSTMLLTALACLDPHPPLPVLAMFARLADAATALLADGFARLSDLAMPERAVFLGAGALTGAARESALKILELTAGQVQTAWDSPLGFRHGPKAVVNAATQVFLLMSGDSHAAAYDRDLGQEIREQFGDAALTVLGQAGAAPDITVPDMGSDGWTAVLHVLVAQMLSVIWSDRLGHNVDDPFAGRNLTRVVSGVRLYDLPAPPVRRIGGMDVGGSKIESVLFDRAMQPLARRRTDIRKANYAELLDTIAAEARWLEDQAEGALDFGIGLPGLIDPATGVALTSNLPASGHPLAADLAARLGRSVTVGNDCKCFALSEATEGAGAGYQTVFGLILGTGLGGGVTIGGKLVTGLNGLPGEVGHFGITAALAQEHHLPILPCGCGRRGCYETLVSGPGLSRLAGHMTGQAADPAAVARRAAAGDAGMAAVMRVWLDLLGQLVHTIQLTIDADCVVLGGGLSRIDGLVDRLGAVFARQKLPGLRSPAFAIAKFGDASGVRGAALMARAGAGGGTEHA